MKELFMVKFIFFFSLRASVELVSFFMHLKNVTIIAPFSNFFTLYHGYLEERFDHALGALSNKNYKNFSWQKD
jgi:hypothetical protein